MMEHYSDLITRCTMMVLEASVFTYYLFTARKFILTSARSENRDAYTLAMIALLTESLSVRIVMTLPNDIHYLLEIAPT